MTKSPTLRNSASLALLAFAIAWPRAAATEKPPTDLMANMPPISIAKVAIEMKMPLATNSQAEFEQSLAHSKGADGSRERMAAVLAGETSLYNAGKLRGQAKIDYLETAARAGDAAAAATLGDMLDTGDGVEEDAARAFGYYLAGALGGRMDAAHNVGAALSKGRGVRRDFTEALAWVIVARARGDVSGVDVELREFLSKHHHEDAIAEAEKRAGELRTKVTPKTLIAALPPVAPITFDATRTEAVETVDGTNGAARGGNAEAPSATASDTPPVVVMTILGERLSWPTLADVERAANRGDPAGLTAMGRLLTNGKLLPPDPERAAVYLERAAALGEIDAAHQLGDLYSKGEGMVRDDAKAFTYSLQAAQGGSTLAMASVGVFYTNGRGAERDVVKGLAWLIVAKHFGVDLGQERRLRAFLTQHRPDDVAKAETLSATLLGGIKVRTR